MFAHCSVDLRAYSWLQTMIFTVEEINRDPGLLPNFTLGYLAFDTCLTEGSTLGAAIAMVTGQDGVLSADECTTVSMGVPTVPVIIGDARSSASIVVADTLGVFEIPMVTTSLILKSHRDHKSTRTKSTFTVLQKNMNIE